MKLVIRSQVLAIGLGAMAIPLGLLACSSQPGSAGAEGAHGTPGADGPGGSDPSECPSVGGAGGSGSATGSAAGGAGGSSAGGSSAGGSSAGGGGTGGGACGGAGGGGPGGGGPGGGGPGAGGGSNSGQPLYASGTRLRARYHDAGDGASLFLGWRDTQLGENCMFRKAEDGVLRCVPDTGAMTTLRFQDNGCTEPVAAVACNAPSQYVTVESGEAGCEANSKSHEVYQMGAEVSDTTTFRKLGNTCAPMAAGTGVVLRAVTKVLPDTFVAATRAAEPQGDRLAMQVLTAADGCREAREMHDLQLDVGCSAQMTSGGQLRCLPLSTTTAGGFFSDSQCGAPVLVQTTSVDGCPAPAYALQQNGVSTCGSTMSAVAVGSSVTPQNVYQGSPQSCSSAPFLPATWKFYTQGAAVDSTTFLGLTEQQAGTGRLRAPFYATEDGHSAAPAGTLYDTARDQVCRVRLFADGTQWCVPDGVASVKFFRDAQCTTPLATLATEPDCPLAAPTEAVQLAPSAGAACPLTVERTYSLGAEFNGNAMYRRAGSNCAQVSASSFGGLIYEIGPEIQPGSVFSAINEIIE